MFILQNCAFFLLTLFLIRNSEQYIRDSSFLRFCEKAGGTSSKVIDEKSPNSDKCEVTWKQFPVSDDEEANWYCKTWGPYPLLEFKMKDKKAWCRYENVLSCRDDYTQIEGNCYRKIDKMMTYEKATKLCKKEIVKTKNGKTIHGDLIRLYDVDLIRLLRAFFTDLKKFFIQPDEYLKEYLEFDGGGRDFAVLIDMAIHFNLGPGAIVKLRSKSIAQVICVYKPEETPLSFGFKARLLAPYYYPMQQDGFMTVWRTSGHYSIMRNMDADIWDATIENVPKLNDNIKSSIVTSYAPYYFCCTYDFYEYGKFQSTLVYKPREYEKEWNCHFREHVDSRHSMKITKTECTRTNKLHRENQHTFLFTPEKINSLDIVERPVVQDAPLLCSIFYKNEKRPTKCADGWEEYVRKSGQGVCTIFVRNKIVRYNSAESECKAIGGELVTFSDEQEYDKLMSYKVPIYLGLRKNIGCTRHDSTEKCNRKNIGVWSNKYGESLSKVKDLIRKKWWNNDPDNANNNEKCLLVHGDFGLIDWSCESDAHLACISGYTKYEE
ncbi:unnamed protein product [Caenorhabditis angaria]|uniref:C-type lectin domain-containing protein n=1 Tax=Caenorhabditis angaria TaxID=860376 RepID=A0A9P1MWT0_9PELO|nr:unnamed protein product [Caenorhabditis angaria]